MKFVIVGLLDRDDVVDLAQRCEQRGTDVGDRPRGDVVEDQRQLGTACGDRLEMGLYAGLVGTVVIGGDDQAGVGTGVGGHLGQLDRVAGVVGAAAEDHGGGLAHLFKDDLEQFDLLVVLERRRRAGG